MLLSHGCDPAALTPHRCHGWVGREVAYVAHRHGADSFASLSIVGCGSPQRRGHLTRGGRFCNLKFNSTFDFLGLIDDAFEQAVSGHL